MTALFISIEGIDGSGKTTQTREVTALLRDNGHRVHRTQEPTTSKTGLLLREKLMDTESHPASDALLFATDRVEHYFDSIKPRLEGGTIVITDRYKTSSLCYQSTQGLQMDWIEEINSQVPYPDITFILTIASEDVIERLDQEREKFEVLDFLKKLEKKYSIMDGRRGNIIKIDASLPQNQVTEIIYDHIISEIDKKEK